MTTPALPPSGADPAASPMRPRQRPTAAVGLRGTARARHVLREVVLPAVFGAALPVEITAHHLHGEPIPYAEARARPYRPFTVGDTWGPAWDTTWFHLSGEIPEAWAGEDVVLRFESLRHPVVGEVPRRGGEALVWRGGVPLQGLSSQHPYAMVARPSAGGEPVELWVEAAANPRTPEKATGDDWPLLLADPDGAPTLRLVRCELAVRDRDVFALACDLRTAIELAEHLSNVDQRAREVVVGLTDACDALDPDDVHAGAAAARAELAAILARPADPGGPRISAVGHAHIDTAWLWPIRETVRKCARTFATAVTLMEEYEDYRFVCSSAQHLAWIEERYPSLFARIQERVAAGQFLPVGGMWVETDCNLPDGESLVRQVVHGQRWFAQRFGVECQEAWLPDAFGYPASLPQILAGAGIRWFLTQKLSWNETNRFPYHGFCWEGIDGTRVRAHFLPSDTYSGDVSLAELARGIESFSGPPDGRWLYAFGHGDGGGGPTREMIEAARRVRDLSGAPRVALEPLSSFFAAAEADPAEVPVWVGELYLEKHRGTYTSQAAVKRANRRNEGLLHAAELWSALRPDAATHWPAAELDRAWKLLLTNQFHDILPGTSIHWVYRDAERDHDEVSRVATAAADAGRGALAAAVDTTGMTAPVTVFNDTSWRRREVLGVEGGLFVADVPPLGYATYDLASLPAGEVAVRAGDGWAENEHLRLRWDGEGRLVSVWDKDHEREVLAPGARGNVFHLHDDRPADFDAWDVDRSYLDAVEEVRGPAAVEVLEAGPLRARVRMRRRFAASALDQTIVLSAGSRRVDFVTTVDWHEDHKLLKVAFPVAVRSPRASYEIQFGHVERPTHENTSWDEARFEVCAHRWADLSEPGYGVALLNDCKYGYDVRGNVLRLSLLRAPTAPDPVCDRGRHQLTYSLLPHAGDAVTGGVVAAGYALNRPLVAVATEPGPGGRPRRASFLWTDDPCAVVSTVKRPDAGDGLIVRLYEASGGRRRVRLGTEVPVVTATRTDLLERPLEAVPVRDGAVELTLGPFEIVTLLLRPGLDESGHWSPPK